MINPSPKYSGEPSAQALASGLATLGRYGDNYMVHAAEGETMIPKEVFDENPGLKQDLFHQMTMMGIEDPNRYVVGNALNSINPITGQPEFFFKKIFRAIKKVFKTVAPIVAPILGNMIAPGIGGLIASGLVTKLQGGSWGDALKSAALSYGAGALTSGIGGALSGTGTFMGGLSEGLTAPFSAATNLFSSGAQNPLAQGIFGPRGTGTIFSSLGGTKEYPSAFAQGDVGVLPRYKTGSQLTRAGIDPATGSYIPPQGYGQPIGTPSAQIDRESSSNFANLGKGESYNDAAYRAARNKGLNPSDAYRLQGEPEAAQKLLSSTSTSAGAAPPAAAQSNTSQLPQGVTKKGDTFFFNGRQVDPKPPPGYTYAAKKPATLLNSETLAKVVEQAAVPTLLAAATYALTPEEESVEDYLKSNPMDPNRAIYDQWSAIADKSSEEAQALKNQWYGQSRYSAEQLKGSFGADPISGITSPSSGSQIVAGNLSNPSNIQGGLGNLGVSGLLSNNLAARNAFRPTNLRSLMADGSGLVMNTRAAGGEIVGPGTGTSDSIPARLSDGEFVMTAQAVRNAGNGDRDVGAARMYDMMNRFERGVV